MSLPGMLLPTTVDPERSAATVRYARSSWRLKVPRCRIPRDWIARESDDRSVGRRQMPPLRRRFAPFDLLVVLYQAV